jgi:hypothetical protein
MARSSEDRCAVAHAPGENSPDNSSARVRQAAKQRVETAYAHAPLMLAHDRRVLDVPLEERLQSRTSELLAWAKTMLPVINRSVRDARTTIKTGHQDIRSYFSKATVVTTGDSSKPPVPSTARPEAATPPVPLVPKQQHHQYRAPECHPGSAQSARTRIATLPTTFASIWHRRYLDPSDINQQNVYENISEPVAGSYLPPVRVEPFLYWNRRDRT